VNGMVAVTTEPAVSTPIARITELTEVPGCGVTSAVARPVGETDTAVNEVELQVTLLVRFCTVPLPVRLPIANSCETAPAPLAVTALGMMVRLGTEGVVELIETVSVAVAEMPA
jgi:hypothetical protein